MSAVKRASELAHFMSEEYGNKIAISHYANSVCVHVPGSGSTFIRRPIDIEPSELTPAQVKEAAGRWYTKHSGKFELKTDMQPHQHSLGYQVTFSLFKRGLPKLLKK